MASGKGIFINALGGLVLRQSRVDRVRDVSPRFRLLSVQGEALRSVEWTPGDKVQLLLPQLDMRTFTPLSWNRQAGTAEFLLYRNQALDESEATERPGTRFIRTVREGDACRFVGPQRSLAAPSDANVVLFGDETSFAVALSLRRAPNQNPACVFEVGDRAQCAAVLAELGLPDAVCIERAEGDSHLIAVNEQLERLLIAQRGAKLLMTGRAQAIQALQIRRRSTNQLKPHKTRAYWSLGRSGLD
jgi:NADPH-dependent ferric siderophore reductase